MRKLETLRKFWEYFEENSEKISIPTSLSRYEKGSFRHPNWNLKKGSFRHPNRNLSYLGRVLSRPRHDFFSVFFRVNEYFSVARLVCQKNYSPFCTQKWRLRGRGLLFGTAPSPRGLRPLRLWPTVRYTAVYSGVSSD